MLVPIIAVGALAPFGILAAIAIPSFVKYMRRAKAAEARIQSARAFDSVLSYHAESGECPHDAALSGIAGPVPPLTVNCNTGPKQLCTPTDDASTYAYSPSAWDTAVWQQMRFDLTYGHFYHYSYQWSIDGDRCAFTVQAFGDLDDDGVYSTFERTGMVGSADGFAPVFAIYRELE